MEPQLEFDFCDSDEAQESFHEYIQRKLKEEQDEL
jgi:hypothetical protein